VKKELNVNMSGILDGTNKPQFLDVFTNKLFTSRLLGKFTPETVFNLIGGNKEKYANSKLGGDVT